MVKGYGKISFLAIKAVMDKFEHDLIVNLQRKLWDATQLVKNIRNQTLDEAAQIAEFHSGPSIQLAEKIRAMKEAG